MVDGGPAVGLGRAGQGGAEHRVGEVVGQPVAVQEGQVAVLQVALPPAQQGRVQGEHHGRVAGGLGPAQQAGGQRRVLGGVELEPPRGVAHRRRHVLQGGGRDAAEDQRDAQGGGGAGHGQLGVGVDDRQHPDGRQEDGPRAGGAQHADGGVAGGDVQRQAGAQAPAGEGRPVGAQGGLAPGPAGDPVERPRPEDLPGARLPRLGGERERGGRPRGVERLLVARAVQGHRPRLPAPRAPARPGPRAAGDGAATAGGAGPLGHRSLPARPARPRGAGGRVARAPPP